MNKNMVNRMMFVSVILTIASLTKSIQPPTPLIKRPELVRNALKNNQPIHYFGLGSNMSRKKIENRGLNGTSIEILNMEAAVVPNYRLAFNMRGFPPLEPGMGSLEPVETDSTRILSYKDAECHGALVKISPENYEKLMKSEGVGNENGADQGYDEIIVEAYPYGSNTNDDGDREKKREPILAVALRARPHLRLNFDPCPSARYMKILKEGASELKLTPSYQEFLARIPVQQMSTWQKEQAIYSIMFTISLSIVLKSRIFNKLQNRLLFLVYAPFSAPAVVKVISTFLTSIILMPTAILGVFLFHFFKLTGKTPPAFTRIATFLGKIPSNETTTSQ